ncbi:MAG: TIM barrel protein [Clostridia bacterium]|nr:TIM barrel protein [Clostridia bacterium]
MRLCVVLPCFFKNSDFCDAIYKISALGYDAAELWGWGDIDPEKAKKALSETGVELLSLCTTEFRLNDPGYRERFLSGLKATCDFAKELNVKRIITQVGNDTGMDREYQRRSIVDGLLSSAPLLAEYGITLMIEPLNTRFDHKGYYLSSSAEAFDIVKEVNSPYVKVIYDIYHQQITEGNIIPTVISNLDHIAHLHAAGHPGRHELHLGENDYRVIVNALDKAGYSGAMGLEYFPTLDPIESLKQTRQLLLNK